MCTYRYDVKTAAKMLRDETNKPIMQWQRPTGVQVEIKRAHRDCITLEDAIAYCKDARDNHERMTQFRKDHPNEHFPIDLCSWPRSHARRLYTRPDGTTYCRMVEAAYDLRLNIPLTA